METNRRTPSVIARLMGLDELPPQQSLNKPQRVLSENYLRKSASIGLLEKRSCHKSWSVQLNCEKSQNFMNISDGPDSPTTDRYRNGLSVQATPSTTEMKMSLLRQKFKGTNWHLKNEKPRSKDSNDDLDSDKELLPRYLHKSDTLFANHLHGLQSDKLHSRSGHVAVMNSNVFDSRVAKMSRKSERRTARQNILRSLQKLGSGSITDFGGDRGIVYTSQLLETRKELNDETHSSPSQIVVLKPHLGRVRNAPSPSLSPALEEDSQPCDKTKNLAATEPSRHSFRVSRVGTEGMASQIKYSESSSLEVSTTELEVENSATESEEIMPSSPSFFDQDRFETTYPPLNRSNFAKQAKKRLLERWKMTKSYQEVGLAGRSTTLGEMLAKPDRETIPRKLFSNLDKNGLTNQLSLSDADAYLGSPFSISSTDAFITVEIPKFKSKNKAVYEKLEPRKQICSQKDNTRRACPRLDFDNNHTIQEIGVIPDQRESGIEKEHLSEEDSEENSIFPTSSSCTLSYCSPDTEAVEVADSENVGVCSGTPKERQFEPLAHGRFMEDAHSCHVLESAFVQESSFGTHEEVMVSLSCSKIDPEFPVSMREGYSPSPDSVLEPPFSEEFVSGSKCFLGYGADLLGLQMQLQLLKSKSDETNSEESGMVVSSDEESRDGSVDLSEENKKLTGLFRAEESRDFSYLVDVLVEGGFDGRTQLGFEGCYSTENPLNLSLFEKLEKKYGEQNSWEKSGRRLLFDRVNSGLKQILQPCTDFLTWAKPLRKSFKLSQSREVIEEELWRFLVSQEKEVNKGLSEKALGTESRWLELWDDIDLIVCEIERFLFDELAEELSVGSF